VTDLERLLVFFFFYKKQNKRSVQLERGLFHNLAFHASGTDSVVGNSFGPPDLLLLNSLYSPATKSITATAAK